MLIKKTHNKILLLIVKQKKNEVLFLDGSKSMKGNLQMGKRKITDLSEGINSREAVNYQQLIDRTVHRNY